MPEQRVSVELNTGCGPDEDCGFGHACSFCPEEADCRLDKPAHNRRLNERRRDAMAQVIMVLANKGGVGKSTVAANLAAALARRGFRVGLGDADVHGPNAAQFLGQQGQQVRVTQQGIAPRQYRTCEGGGTLLLGSLGFFLSEPDSPVVWRDAYKFDYMHHLLGSYDWGALDFWVLDMPPGTGNELITACDMLEGVDLSAVLVTTSQAVALLDTLKAARFCRERGVPVLGAVENMAAMSCPHCQGEIELFPRHPRTDELASAGIATLARVPLSRALAVASDDGTPVVDAIPDSAEAQAFMQLAQCCIAKAAGEAKEHLEDHLRAVLAAPEHLEAIDESEAGAEDNDVKRQLEELLAQERRRLGTHRT